MEKTGGISVARLVDFASTFHERKGIGVLFDISFEDNE
jgi:hypothetical protein